MASLIRYTCVILLPFVGVFYIIKADRSGTVVFMEAGSDVSLAEMFHDSVYNDRKNSTKYLWDFTALMTGPNFRSPLLDIGIDLNMTHFHLYAYNAAGEVMTSFPITFTNSALSSAAGNLTLTDTDSLASLVLHAENATERIRFLSINVKSTQPYGAQFILTTDDDFHDLPEIEMIGCYRFNSSDLFTSLADTWTTQSGDECEEHCVTKNGSMYALAFTAVINSVFSHRCSCVAGLSSATSVSYSPLMCPDDSDCGCLHFFKDNSSVYASVYDMGPINSFLNNLTTYTDTTIMFSADVNVQDNCHDLGQRYFVTKIQFLGFPDVPYMLGVAEGCGSASNFTYYGQGLGSPQVFNGSTVQTLYPTPVRCLKLEILKNNPDNYTVNLGVITDECHPMEVLSNTTAVPDTWVNIKQMNESTTNTSYWNDIPFPEMSTGVVNLTLPNETHQYFVLQKIKLIASVDTIVHTDVETDGMCVAIGTGNMTHQKYDMQSMLNVTGNSSQVIDIPNICARNIFFVMNTTNPTGSLSSRVNRLKFVLQGCVVESDLYANCTTTNITDSILATGNVSWYWVPHPVRAVTYLRPGGPGLVLHRYEDPYIVIQLSENSTPVEVKRVSIRGDVISADIAIGNVNSSIFNDSTTILDYTPAQALGHEVRIDNIIGRSDIPTGDVNFDFLLIHVEIDICIVATGAPINSTPPLTTSSSTTSATTSSPLSSNISSTLPAPKQTPAATTTGTTASPHHTTPSTTTIPNTIPLTSQQPISSTTSGTPSVPISTSTASMTSSTTTQTPTTTSSTTTTPPTTAFSTSTTTPTTASSTNTTTPATTSSNTMTAPTTTSSTTITTSSTTSATTITTPSTTSSNTMTAPTTTSSTTTPTPTTTSSTTITTPTTTSSTTITTPTTTSSTTITTPTTTSSTTIATQTTTSSSTTAQATTSSSTTVTPTTISYTSAAQPTTTSYTSSVQPTTTHSTTTAALTTIPSSTSATQATGHTTTTAAQTTTSTTAALATTTSSSASVTSLPPTTTTQTTTLTSSSSSSSVTSTPSITTSVETVTTESSAGTTTAPPPPPTPCCVCFSNTENMTQDEVDVRVQQLVQNLTVPRRSTSAFKRSLISAPDNRTSAKMVGTAGIAMMTLSGGLIVAMDYTHIVAVVQFCKHAIKGFFLA